MLKTKLLFLFIFKMFLINFTFSNNLAIEMFSLGMEFKYGNINDMHVNFALPTVYLMDSNKNMLLSLQAAEFVFNEKIEYKSMLIAKTDFMYSINFDDIVFVGPFVNTGLKSIDSPEFSLNTGIRLHMMTDLDLFGDSLPSYMRILSCDLGYSIDEDRYYIKGSADFLVALAIAGISYVSTLFEDFRMGDN